MGIHLCKPASLNCPVACAYITIIEEAARSELLTVTVELQTQAGREGKLFSMMFVGILLLKYLLLFLVYV